MTNWNSRESKFGVGAMQGGAESVERAGGVLENPHYRLTAAGQFNTTVGAGVLVSPTSSSIRKRVAW